MNEFVDRFGWLAGQVTILSLAAAGLYAVVARRPGAAAGVTLAGLSGFVVLTVLAVLPLPAWWSWAGLQNGTSDAAFAARPGPPDAVFGPSTDDNRAKALAASPLPPPEESDTVAPRWSLSSLRRIWGRLLPTGGATHQNPLWGWSIGVPLLVGMCVGVVRLLLGLYAVRRCQSNSTPIDDPALGALLDGLRRGMDCRRRIEVREATDVGGPVTVGWRRPVVLLPPQWRTWAEGELRAVLAHEVAHVRRADYAAWLLARFSVALHFYHPLAHWLASRLHLQQELAADALAACHAGGRRLYLRALAQLALRQEESLCTGPARAFLPAPGTLVRRIAMLRTEEKGADRFWLRPFAVLLLALVVPGVSGLRGPARADDKPPVPNAAVTTQKTPAILNADDSATAKRPPFVYCLCAPDAAGIFAFRPAVFFTSDTSMQKYADEINRGIAEGLNTIGSRVSVPKIEEIEQISGSIFLKVNEEAPKGQRGMLFGSLLTLRTTREYDWKQIIGSIAKKVTDVHVEGFTYYKVAQHDLLVPMLFALVAEASRGDRSICFFQPDRRTLAIGSEQQFKDMVRNGPTAKPAWAVAAGWERVERGVFAAVINNQEQRFANVWLKAPPNEMPAEVNAAIAKMNSMVIGLDCDRELRAALFTAYTQEQDAVAMANALIRWAADGQTLLRKALAQPDHKADRRLLWGQRFLEAFSVSLERAADESKQTIVHAQGHSKGTFAEWLDAVSQAKVEAVEVKDK